MQPARLKSHLSALTLLLLAGACHQSATVSTAPVPQTVLAPGASGPASIPCDTPVVVHATTDGAGVAEEHQWLAEHYPGSRLYNQALRTEGKRAFDILEFTDTSGRHVSVCFDITSSYGHFSRT